MQLNKSVVFGKTDREKWQAAYRGGTRPPWDSGLAHPLTLNLIEQAEKMALLRRPGRILVPGAGLSHDAALLAERGYGVTAMDFVPQAITLSKERYGLLGNLKFLQWDAFTPLEGAGLFEAIFDQGMLCPLQPQERRRYLTNAVRQLRPGGIFLLISVSGLHPRMPSGPPFILNGGELLELFGPEFECHYRREHACFDDRVTRQVVSLWRKGVE